MVATSYTIENKTVSLLKYIVWLWLLPINGISSKINLVAILTDFFFEDLRLEVCADRVS